MLASATVAYASGNRESVGHSVKGRLIVAKRLGEPDAPFKVLVVGSIHGDEPQGVRVVRRLRKYDPNGARQVEFWTITTVNPDGIARGTRKNARGVDLNRNFPYRFDPNLNGGYNSGPRPASEPETRAVMKLARKVRFDLAIWYHQPWGRTLIPCNRDARWVRVYARYSGLGGGKGCERGYYPGSAISWQHHVFGTTAFVVEFGDGVQPRGVIKRHARAVVRLAKRMR
ncbi:MAG: M14 family zinc carboxypeptidase [Solirubrobacterales bacterium]